MAARFAPTVHGTGDHGFIPADDVSAHFGWIGAFFAMDLAATSTRTRDLLGWTPTGPTLVEDVAAGAYDLH